MTEGELRFGLAKSPSSLRQRALEQFLGAFVVYPWGSDAAAAYGALRARQERLGKKLGPYDTQIAAHAVALGAVLVSHDSAFVYQEWGGDSDVAAAVKLTEGLNGRSGRE